MALYLLHIHDEWRLAKMAKAKEYGSRACGNLDLKPDDDVWMSHQTTGYIGRVGLEKLALKLPDEAVGTFPSLHQVGAVWELTVAGVPEHG